MPGKFDLHKFNLVHLQQRILQERFRMLQLLFRDRRLFSMHFGDKLHGMFRNVLSSQQRGLYP